MTVLIENRSVALGTCRLEQFLLNPTLISLSANKVRTAGPIGTGETLIDVFRLREDDGAC